jgi:hypothetical protein
VVLYAIAFIVTMVYVMHIPIPASNLIQQGMVVGVVSLLFFLSWMASFVKGAAFITCSIAIPGAILMLFSAITSFLVLRHGSFMGITYSSASVTALVATASLILVVMTVFYEGIKSLLHYWWRARLAKSFFATPVCKTDGYMEGYMNVGRAPYLVCQVVVNNVVDLSVEQQRKGNSGPYSIMGIGPAFLGNEITGFMQTAQRYPIFLSQAMASSAAILAVGMGQINNAVFRLLLTVFGASFGLWLPTYKRPDNTYVRKPSYLFGCCMAFRFLGQRFLEILIHFATWALLLVAGLPNDYVLLDPGARRAIALTAIGIFLSFHCAAIAFSYYSGDWKKFFYMSPFALDLQRLLGLSWLTNQDDETPPLLNVSDGGHMDNTALYEMLRRRLRLIFVAHCPPRAASGVKTDDLRNVLKLARDDFGCSFAGVSHKDFQSLEDCVAANKPLPRRLHRELSSVLLRFDLHQEWPYLLIHVTYPHDKTLAVPTLGYDKMTYGLIVYMQATREVPHAQLAAVRPVKPMFPWEYLVANQTTISGSFPNFPTAHQFLNSEQAEAMNRCGYLIMEEVLIKFAPLICKVR